MRLVLYIFGSVWYEPAMIIIVKLIPFRKQLTLAVRGGIRKEKLRGYHSGFI